LAKLFVTGLANVPTLAKLYLIAFVLLAVGCLIGNPNNPVFQLLMLTGLLMLVFAMMESSARIRRSAPKDRQSVPRRHSRTIPQDVKIAVSVRDGGKCRICGSTVGLHYDHIVPYSLGGHSDDVNNIQLLCSRHNLSKGNRYIG
jgi:hypothetical protein